MTDGVFIVSDSSLQTVEVVEIPAGTVVVTEDQGSQSFDIVENSSVPMQVVDSQYGVGLDGFPVLVANPQPGDVISYMGSAFRNRAQTDLTDGGNF